MKVNEIASILTPRVTLVPYEARHVNKYHKWMSDPDIQEATASEPLTLEEEYENQASWRTSHDKLTFIICQPLSTVDAGQFADSTTQIKAGSVDHEDAMVGDVNFFLYPYDEDDDDDDKADGTAQQPAPAHNDYVGEIDVMVAEKGNRGQGMGFGAVTALMMYVHRHLGEILEEHAKGAQGQQGKLEDSRPPGQLRGLMVKIKESNEKSLALFKRVGFTQKGGVNYFGEVEMVLDDFDKFMAGGDERNTWLKEGSEGYREIVYVK